MHSRINTIALGVAVLSSAAVMAAGCGSDDEKKASDTQTKEKTVAQAPATGESASTLKLAADPGGKSAFDNTALTAKAGKTTIDFENASQVPHAVEIEGNGVMEETKTIQGGKTSLTADLKPGKYEFYCPVGDHKAEGMKGTLTVN